MEKFARSTQKGQRREKKRDREIVQISKQASSYKIQLKLQALAA